MQLLGGRKVARRAVGASRCELARRDRPWRAFLAVGLVLPRLALNLLLWDPRLPLRATTAAVCTHSQPLAHGAEVAQPTRVDGSHHGALVAVAYAHTRIPADEQYYAALCDRHRRSL